ncbi:undecaprenyl diphosphate synthase family protein [Palleronia rufa]|uniref:undecaprenyl diphosphate synthase family protein n=1 Tax=Palleronia rufa TaxID=1530186 RepID=UPI000AC6932F|nr:undecaprenyl diphosphate synthase family protein [Palleronia rufa]
MKHSLPMHVGFIPDGNRRWAVQNGFSKDEGYRFGIEPGLTMFKICKKMGIPEISVFGFTQDNTKRPTSQIQAFRSACVDFVLEIADQGAALLVWEMRIARNFLMNFVLSERGKETGSRSNF